MTVLLIDYARETVGLPMGSVFLNQHFGWTTDAEKAAAMQAAGASVTNTPSLDRRPEARKFDGFEVSFQIGAETIGRPRP